MAGTFDEDPVRLKLAGQEVPIAKNYSVRCSVLEVPAAFEISVGHGGMVAELAAQYPEETPFELFVGTKLVQTGETDGYSVNPDSSSISIHGRDYLRRLHDTQILDERTFSEKTFVQLTEMALKEVGLEDRSLISTNAANRKAITGKDSIEIDKKILVDETETGVTTGTEKEKVEVYKTIKGEVGTTWLEFLIQQYRKAGLFIWSDHFGNFVLSQPNGAQKPLYRLVRRRGSQFNEVSILGQPSFERSVIPRYSEYIVVGRGGGGKHGRGTILERMIDDEMVAILNPNPADRKNGGVRRKPLIIRDHHVRTPQQAKLFARRRMAECRRAGWRYGVTVAGHSVPTPDGGRAVWAPDTTVEVIDEELGIVGVMYVEGVTFMRRTETVTQLHLLRIDDLCFAEEPVETMKKRPKLQVRRGVTTVERPTRQLQGQDIFGTPVSAKNVWVTDPSVSVGAPVLIDPEHDATTQTTTKVTSKPLTFGSQADVGVAADDTDPQKGWPTKPTP